MKNDIECVKKMLVFILIPMNNFQGGALDQICVFERFLEGKKY